MGTRNTYQKTLLIACMIAGDEEALAKRLAVPTQQVLDWLLGDAYMPTEIFLKAVDIALGSSKQHTRDVKAFLAAVRERQQERPN